MDPFMKSLDPASAVQIELAEKKRQITELAHYGVEWLREKEFPRLNRLLINRTPAKKQILVAPRNRWFRTANIRPLRTTYEETAGWSLGYFGPHEPHLRNLYLLVDGTFAIDEIGKRQRRSSSDVWTKVEPREFPTLVPFSADEIPDIDSCQKIAVKIMSLLARTARTIKDAPLQIPELYWSIVDSRKK